MTTTRTTARGPADTGANVTCHDADHRIYREVLTERARAHAKHGNHSIEAQPVGAAGWLAILAEEVGEVTEQIFALALNQALGKVAHACTYDQNPARRRGELIQVMAVASAWITALDHRTTTTAPTTSRTESPSPRPAPRADRRDPDLQGGHRSVRFEARFDSTCPACGESIAAGEDVAWHDGDVVHDACAIDAGVEVFDR